MQGNKKGTPSLESLAPLVTDSWVRDWNITSKREASGYIGDAIIPNDLISVGEWLTGGGRIGD